MKGIPAPIVAKAGRVRLIAVDSDGVLTDGRIIIGSDGTEFRAFHSRDGLGVKLGQRAGLRFAVVSGRTSAVLAARAGELGFEEIHQGVDDKGACIRGILERHGLPREALCYVGDDLNDLPALRVAGLSAAPADADPEVRRAVDWVTTPAGGRGAVREVIDLILEAKNARAAVIAAYVSRSE